MGLFGGGGGNTKSTFNALSIATKAVSEAYISVVQNISQSVAAIQEANIDCTAGKQQCFKCIMNMVDANKEINAAAPGGVAPASALFSPAFIGRQCSQLCECKVSGLNMNQKMTVNFSAFADASVKTNFATMVSNNVTQAVSQQTNGGSAFGPPDGKSSNITDIVNNIHTTMVTKDFSKQLAGAMSKQVFNFSGPGVVENVTMDQMMSTTVSQMAKFNSTTNVLNELTTQITQMTQQTTNGLMAQLVALIVQLVMAVIVIIALIFAINQIFRLYTTIAIQ